MRRLSIVFLLLFALSSCRTSVHKEAGLGPENFTSQMPRLTSDVRGFWYLVVPDGDPIERYVTLERNGESKPFYAIVRGRRTAQLLPMTRGAYTFLDTQRDGPVNVNFTATATDIKTTDKLGWFDGATLTWLGPKPKNDERVVLTAPEFDEDIRISTWLVGTAMMKEDGLTEVNAQSTNVFVIPDGRVGALPDVVAYGAVNVADPSPIEMRSVSGEIPQGFSSNYFVGPLAKSLATDVLVYQRSTYNIVFNTRPRIENGLEVGVTEVPLLFSTDSVETRTGLKAVVDASNGNYLTALFGFLKTSPATTGGIYGAQLRLVELAAVSGFVDWTRFAILNNAPGLNADDAIYLARAHLFEGHLDRATFFTNRAVRVFGAWRENDRLAGLGRANLLLSVIHELDGDLETALELALAASKFFVDGGDELRAAGAEQRAAHLALTLQKYDIAVRAGSLARSRFYHGNARYQSGLSEIDLADIYHRSGDDTKANEMLDFAQQRFSKLGDEVGVARANIARARLKSDPAALKIHYERALANGDKFAAADAAASMVLLGGAHEKQLPTVIVPALFHGANPFARSRARASMDVLCAEISETSDALVQRACKVETTAIATTPTTGSETMLLRGHEALSNGNIGTAEKIAAELAGQLTEQLRQQDPMLAARILIFDAEIDQAKEANFSSKLNEAIDLLRKSVDPTKLSGALEKLSDELAVRSVYPISYELLNRSILAAESSGQKERLRFLNSKRLQISYGAQNWSDLTEAVRLAEPVFLRLQNPAGMLAVLRFYEAAALTKLGKSSEGAGAIKAAETELSKADPVDQVRALAIGARVLADGADFTSAERFVLRGKETINGTAKGQIPDEEAASLNADFDLISARVKEARGEAGAAYTSYKRAYQSVLSFSTFSSTEQQVRALRSAGRVAPDTTETKWVVSELERIAQTGKSTVARWALAEIELLSGAPDRAFKLVSAVQSEDIIAQCLRGRSLALLGKFEKARSPLELCSRSTTTEDAFEAKIISALASPSTLAEKRADFETLEKSFDKRLSRRQLERIKLALELLTFRPKKASVERSLQEVFADAKTATKIRKSATGYATHLVSTGRPIAALSVLDDERVRTAFYEKESFQTALIRLRISAMLVALQPAKTMNYGYQVADALDENANGADHAAILLAVAKNDFVSGLWHHGRTILRDAYEIAKTNKAKGIKQEIEALAKRFDIVLK